MDHKLRSVDNFYQSGKNYYPVGLVTIDNVTDLSSSDLDLLYQAVYFGRFNYHNTVYDLSAVVWEFREDIDRSSKVSQFTAQFISDDIDRDIFDVQAAAKNINLKTVSFYVSRRRYAVFSTIREDYRKSIQKYDVKHLSKAMIPFSGILNFKRDCKSFFKQ